MPICSASEYATYRSIPIAAARHQLAQYHRAAIDRRPDVVVGSRHVYKWFRPWDINRGCVPTPGPGDFTIGLEMERRFNDVWGAGRAAAWAARLRRVALDTEGQPRQLELTFPPILYSSYLKNPGRSQWERYAAYLAEHPSEHRDAQFMGTHINVGMGSRPNSAEVGRLDIVLYRTAGGHAGAESWSNEDRVTLFGRAQPYGFIYNQGTFLEYKMFQTVADPKALRKYIKVAVELTRIIRDGTLPAGALSEQGEWLRQRLLSVIS